MKEPATMKDKIYNMILDDIVSHQYVDRDIINEKDLVDKYGCSKTPIREALIALCNENVLRSIPRYGYEVVRLTADDVMNMLHYRYSVESGIVAPRLDRFGENQISALRDIDNDCRESNNIWELWDSNANFHIRLLTFAGNPYAGDQIESCLNILKRAYSQFCWDNATPPPVVDDVKHHDQILKALEEKDKDLYLTSIRADIFDYAGSQISHYYGL